MAPLYGPTVRCKPNVMISIGLALLYPALGAASLLAIMDIRAHPISF